MVVKRENDVILAHNRDDTRPFMNLEKSRSKLYGLTKFSYDQTTNMEATGVSWNLGIYHCQK